MREKERERERGDEGVRKKKKTTATKLSKIQKTNLSLLTSSVPRCESSA
jgi:hypothetical protein